MGLIQNVLNKNYTLVTSLSVDEVRTRMAANIEPTNYFRFASLWSSSSGDRFQGYFQDDQFNISRIWYRNKTGYTPVITGKISSFMGETNIDVIVRPSNSFYIVYATLIVAFLVVLGCILNGMVFKAPSGTVIAFFLLGICSLIPIMIVKINIDNNVFKRVFCKLLEATEKI